MVAALQSGGLALRKLQRVGNIKGFGLRNAYQIRYVLAHDSTGVYPGRKKPLSTDQAEELKRRAAGGEKKAEIARDL